MVGLTAIRPLMVALLSPSFYPRWSIGRYPPAAPARRDRPVWRSWGRRAGCRCTRWRRAGSGSQGVSLFNRALIVADERRIVDAAGHRVHPRGPLLLRHVRRHGLDRNEHLSI